MNLKECISVIRDALVAKPDLLRVDYVTNRSVANDGELLIGQGTRPQCGADTAHSGICLNNKGAQELPELTYDSVSRFAAEAAQEVLEQWQGAVRSRNAEPLQPKEVLGAMRIICEDVSPDSVLALGILLTRLAGGTVDDQARRWVRYVERWELGDVRSTGAPESSFGVALSALTQHTAIGLGFTLMALYQPHAKGIGNDVVITVGTTSGPHLQEFCTELESLEDQRMGEYRPCDQPRQGVASSPDGERFDGRNAPSGRHTMGATTCDFI